MPLVSLVRFQVCHACSYSYSNKCKTALVAVMRCISHASLFFPTSTSPIFTPPHPPQCPSPLRPRGGIACAVLTADRCLCLAGLLTCLQTTWDAYFMGSVAEYTSENSKYGIMTVRDYKLPSASSS